jgi:hypothetical protein
MIQIDFHDEAMKFVKKVNYAVPVQVIEEAMRHGASLIVGETAKAVQKARENMERKRADNFRG